MQPNQEVADEHPYRVSPNLIYSKDAIHPIWLREFRHWFVNRPEFYVQCWYTKREDYERGGGYFRAKEQVTGEDICDHLRGKKTIGVYGTRPTENTSKWLCLDADCEQSKADDWLGTIQEQLAGDGISSAWENSRRGGHLWILCDQPVPSLRARIYLCNLLDSIGVPIHSVRGNKEGVEINPKQESLEAGKFGNGVRAPLGIHRKDKQRYWFRDAKPDLESQFAYLRRLPRLSAEELELQTLGMTMPEDLVKRPVRYEYAEFGERDDQNAFNIARYVPLPAEWFEEGEAEQKKWECFVQCPGCLANGKDTTKDNLHVTKFPFRKRPVFYCHAGCSARDVIHGCLRSR